MKHAWKAVHKWIVNENNYDPDVHYPDEIDWIRALPFILVNLSCLFVFYVGFSWIAFKTALVLYFVRIFSVTAFYHRYFSHKTYQTNRFWQFVFALIAGTSAQRGPLWWASHHRDHHMFSDKATDVHSPLQHGFWWSHVGWFLSKKNYHYNPARVKDLARYPELVFLDRYDTLMPALLFVALAASGFILKIYAPQTHTGPAQMIVWGFSISMIALFNTTVLINSLCHVFGSQRFATQDSSKNNFILALLTLGEGWHNNHHHYPATARQGFFWWEIDITYYIIRLLELVGIVWNVKKLPKSVLTKDRICN